MALSGEVNTVGKSETKIFDIPMQYANFVSFVWNSDEVALQFAQTSTVSVGEIIPIAKIVMTRARALQMAEIFREVEQRLRDEDDAPRGGDNEEARTVARTLTGADHPLNHIIGARKDDPLWERVAENIRAARQASKEEADTTDRETAER